MNRKVLIVEDHDSLRLLLGSFLSKSFDVVSAKNGLEAMGWLSKGEMPDVIITDLRMPELNGNQFLSNLKCSGMFRDIPVVVISASENEDDERRYRALGARDFIRKPFNPVNLKERLLQIMPASEYSLQGNSVA
jgi:CheY-like chemotaxis protein